MTLPTMSEAVKRECTIIIPHLPFRELSQNSRVHWAVKARAVKAQREEAGWLAKAQWQNRPPMTHARISYEFTVKDKRRRDISNLVSACKSLEDGIVDAGVVVDDDAKHLEVGHILLTRGDTEQIIIKVEERLK